MVIAWLSRSLARVRRAFIESAAGLDRAAWRNARDSEGTMPKLHDPSYRDAIKSRLQSVKPDAPRKWGTMTVDQMMWHLGAGLGFMHGLAAL